MNSTWPLRAGKWKESRREMLCEHSKLGVLLVDPGRNAGSWDHGQIHTGAGKELVTTDICDSCRDDRKTGRCLEVSLNSIQSFGVCNFSFFLGGGTCSRNILGSQKAARFKRRNVCVYH